MFNNVRRTHDPLIQAFLPVMRLPINIFITFSANTTTNFTNQKN